MTAEKFYKAVSHLVIDSHVMVLTMPSPKQETFMFLEQCFERGWIRVQNGLGFLPDACVEPYEKKLAQIRRSGMGMDLDLYFCGSYGKIGKQLFDMGAPDFRAAHLAGMPGGSLGTAETAQRR